jgi:hypothetical protein
MNAEPLTRQPLFTAAIAIPIISFLALGYICWSGHSLDISASGFNNFLAISKLPLGALSLSIPFGVVVNNVHRTIQTDKQIKEAEKKNKIDFFYAHRKNTIEVLQNLEFMSLSLPDCSQKLEFSNCYSTYKKCYPYASATSSDFSYSLNLISNVEIIWKELCALIEKEEPHYHLSVYSHILQIEQMFDLLHRLYGFKDYNHTQLFLSTFPSFDNEDVYFYSKFRNDESIKLYILAYWRAHLLICETIEHEVNKELLILTDNMIAYSFSDDAKYSSYHSNRPINETKSKLIRVKRT